MALDRVFRIDFYPQEWLTQTSILKLEQRGLFIQIVAMIYANRGPIKNDPAWIAHAANCHTKTAKTIIAQLVEMDFIQLLEGGSISQRRAVRELSAKRQHFDSSSLGGRQKAINERELNENKDLFSSDSNNSLHSSYATATATATASPLASEVHPPTPLEKPAEKPDDERAKKTTRKSTPIGDDFQPDFSGLELCSKFGIEPDGARSEFIDYWKSIGKPMSDWQAAFRNRVRQLAKFSAERDARKTGQRSGTSSIAETALRVGTLRQQRKNNSDL